MEHTLFPNGVGRPRAATISPESLQHCSLRANIKPEVVSFLIMFYLNMDTVGFKRAWESQFKCISVKWPHKIPDLYASK